MPREQKKRGRRGASKRDRDEDPDTQSKPVKRQKSEDVDNEVEIVVDNEQLYHEEAHDTLTGPGDLPFYGMLDDDEQEYFKSADSILELNQFADAEERNLFVANVYREANGKELKIANSQSCSRLMERLILMSSPEQLKALFQRFSGHFLHLVQHRFASHCCETLFSQSAPLVTQELTAPIEDQPSGTENGEIYVSMENLFLYTVNELEGNLGYLMTQQFASHTIRVLLVVLSGRPLIDSATTALLQSKKKENIDVAIHTPKSLRAEAVQRAVPDSFHVTIDKIMLGTVAGLDTTSIRALAAHPLGNPVLQVMLELEFSRLGKSKAGDENSLFRRLLPDDPPTEGTASASFINGLLYDSIGSRLLEVILQFAPGKAFKAIYRSLFRERLGSLARNDIAGFVVIRLLERLSKEDLEYAVEQICPQIDSLIQRSRTSVIKILIERCLVRKIETLPIAISLTTSYGREGSNALMKMLKLEASGTEEVSQDRKRQLEAQDTGRLHGSLLAQAMLDAQGSLQEIVTSSILTMDIATLVLMAKDRTATHVLQKSLAYQEHNGVFRRKIIQRFLSHISELSLDAIASHVIDKFWTATEGFLFIRERIAGELLENEASLRESFSGRAVWRNWMMDLYKRRRTEWISRAKDIHSIAVTDPIGKIQLKTSIALAREKFAAARTSRQRTFKAQTGSNGVSIST